MEKTEEQKKRVYVRFSTNPSAYIFDAGDIELKAGDSVLVNTEMGQAVAKVVRVAADIAVEDLGEIKPILRKLNEKDLARLDGFAEKETEYFNFCRERIDARKLPMKLIRVEQAFDGSKATFYFTANTRVDFRDLLKDLVEKYRTRIELRQVGPRQETAMLGGIGACGRELCCCSYLYNFQRISVKMAKYQNMTLNPTKISGNCGKLKCCLAYEKDVYSDLITNLPKVGKRVFVRQGQGVVVSINVVEQTFVARLEDRRFLKCRADEAITEEAFRELEGQGAAPAEEMTAPGGQRPAVKAAEGRPGRDAAESLPREETEGGETRKRSRRPRGRSRNRPQRAETAGAEGVETKPQSEAGPTEPKRRSRRRPRNRRSNA